MSRNVRAIREVWGACSSCFVSFESTKLVIAALSEEAHAGDVSEWDRSNGTVCSVPDGDRFLDYLRDMPVDDLVTVICNRHSDIDVDELKSLLQNIQNLVDEWRMMLDEDVDGLSFFIDGCQTRPRCRI
jgi:hypothetical protein